MIALRDRVERGLQNSNFVYPDVLFFVMNFMNFMNFALKSSTCEVNNAKLGMNFMNFICNEL